MTKNLKKFRKKGSTFDIEFKDKQKKLKKNPTKKLKPLTKQKNYKPKDWLEEE